MANKTNKAAPKRMSKKESLENWRRKEADRAKAKADSRKASKTA
jgi:hypothetical protein